MKLLNKNRLIAASILLSGAMVSCNKSYLDTVPSNAITPDKAYESIASLNSNVNGAILSVFEYSPQAGGGAMHDAYGQKSIDLANDLMGNDMIVHAQGYGWYNADYQYTGWTLPNGVNRRSDITWTFYYNLIKQANLALDNTSSIVNPSAEQLGVIGEFLAIRAWSYFGLINNFQQTYKGNEAAKGVPLYTSLTTPKGRGTVQEVYTQIIADLTKAEQYLTGITRANKTRIDASVVRGFRARVALAMEDFPTAAQYANLARQGYSLMSNTVYQSRSGFSKIDNTEWMWGSFIPADQATVFASFYSHIDATQFGYAQLGGQKKIPKALYDKIPLGDIRKNVFRAPGTGTSTLPDYTQTKFAVPTVGSWAADYLYMRAAEMFLIEAEALARSGQNNTAIRVLEDVVKPKFDNATPYLTENFSSITAGSNTDLQAPEVAWTGNTNFTAINNVYQANGSLRLGDNLSNTGSVITRAASVVQSTLPVSLIISFTIKGGLTIQGDSSIDVTVDGVTKKVKYSSIISDNSQTRLVLFPRVPANSTVRISTTSSNPLVFIDNITITPTYSAEDLSGAELINEILLQRRIELWGEGFSLFDIKRTKSGLNRPQGAGNHGAPNFNPVVYTLPDASPLFLMRIPQRELDNNPSMTAADQNP